MQSTDELWLYISMLEIDLKNVTLTDANERSIQILNRTTVTNQQELSIFKLAEYLMVGMTYQIKFMSYTGYIQSNSAGFFAINYTNDGQPQTMFVTQGECCYIRRIFPMFR